MLDRSLDVWRTWLAELLLRLTGAGGDYMLYCYVTCVCPFLKIRNHHYIGRLVNGLGKYGWRFHSLYSEGCTPNYDIEADPE